MSFEDFEINLKDEYCLLLHRLKTCAIKMSRTSAELLRMKQNSIRMMARRGYDVREDQAVLGYSPIDLEYAYPAHALSTITPDLHTGGVNALRVVLNQAGLFNPKKLRSTLSTIYARQDDPSAHAIVYFVPDQPDNQPAPKTTSKSMTDALVVFLRGDQYPHLRIDALIIIANAPLSSANDILKDQPPEVDAKTGLPTSISPLIQFYFDYQMCHEPEAHYMTPRHVLCTPQQQFGLFEQNTVDPQQHNRILIDDAVGRRIGLKVNQVVRTEQFSMLSEQLSEQQPCYRVVTATVNARAQRALNRKAKEQAKEQKALEEQNLKM